MKKITLTNESFKHLYKIIWDKFNKNTSENLSINQIYGFGVYDENEPNLKKKFIEVHKNPSKAKINGKYLYDRVRELEKKEPYILLSGIYADVFLKYAGFSSLKNFIDLSLPKFDEVEQRRQRLVLENPNSENVTEFSTDYIGYYYSYKYHIVKKFKLSIDYDIKPPDYPKNKYKAVQQGLQDRDPNNPNDKGDLYSGYAEETGGYLYIYLTNNELDIRLHFISALSKSRAKDKTLLLASYQAVSTNNYVINGETLLVREDSNNNLSTLENLIIYRYLFLQRKNFRILEKNLFSVSDLRVKRVVKINKIKHMIGVYRIWNYDRNKNIIQSVFKIYKNYTSNIHTILEIEPQLCLLNIYGDYTENLYVSSHPKEGVGIKNYAIVSIPPYNFKEASKYVPGVFCTIGIGRGKGPYGGDIVMMWESENTELDIEIREIKKDNISSYIGDNKDLMGLHKKLKEGNIF